MNVIKLLSGILGATVLMCYDFYQEWGLWQVLPKWTWMIIGFALLLFSVYAPASKSKMSHFYVEVTVMIYLVFLIMLLPNLGGRSSIGFSIQEPFLWIVILLTGWQLLSYRKRIIKEMEENKKK
ncbi:hypothetical protein [Rummeliibacillus pycnus]|uniref:hypothetical protein n=1 Tax=Rummeliibacillus pycnus TaxID=101070 RepID=UPI000C9C994A|nr:hypothetical protein [Rummeliibacillus pycnus]